MTTTEKATVRDLIERIPAQLGFHVTESAVLCALNGSTVVCTIRQDLSDDMQTMAEELAQSYEQADFHSDAVLAIVFSASRHQGEAALDALADAFDLPMMGIHADGGRYWERDGDQDMPYSDRTSVWTAEAVYGGIPIDEDRARMVESFQPIPDAGVELMAQRHAAQLLDAEDGDAFRNKVMLALMQGLDGVELDSSEIGCLALAATIQTVRDELWTLQSRANARCHSAVWKEVAVRSPKECAPDAYALAGFAYWLRGDGARGKVCAEQALAIKPGHPIADLLLQTVVSGMSPEKWDSYKSNLV